MYNVNMNESGYIDFEWDDRKAESNVGKHAVTFNEACESFYDPMLVSLTIRIIRVMRRGSFSSG